MKVMFLDRLKREQHRRNSISIFLLFSFLFMSLAANSQRGPQIGIKESELLNNRLFIEMDFIPHNVSAIFYILNMKGDTIKLKRLILIEQIRPFIVTMDIHDLKKGIYMLKIKAYVAINYAQTFRKE